MEAGAFEERGSRSGTAARDGSGLVLKGTSAGRRYQGHRDLNTPPKMRVAVPKAGGQAAMTILSYSQVSGREDEGIGMKVQSGIKSAALRSRLETPRCEGTPLISGRNQERGDRRARLSTQVTSRACKGQELTFHASACL